MLVTFSTNAYSDITMFGEVALTLLKMMDHSATIPGTILAAEVPEALRCLTATLNKEKSSSTPDEDKEGHEPVVSIANRALPLINLLAAAAKAGSNVMWE
jgi:hypothetical protein